MEKLKKISQYDYKFSDSDAEKPNIANGTSDSSVNKQPKYPSNNEDIFPHKPESDFDKHFKGPPSVPDSHRKFFKQYLGKYPYLRVSDQANYDTLFKYHSPAQIAEYQKIHNKLARQVWNRRRHAVNAYSKYRYLADNFNDPEAKRFVQKYEKQIHQYTAQIQKIQRRIRRDQDYWNFQRPGAKAHFVPATYLQAGAARGAANIMDTIGIKQLASLAGAGNASGTLNAYANAVDNQRQRLASKDGRVFTQPVTKALGWGLQHSDLPVSWVLTKGVGKGVSFGLGKATPFINNLLAPTAQFATKHPITAGAIGSIFNYAKKGADAISQMNALPTIANKAQFFWKIGLPAVNDILGGVAAGTFEGTAKHYVQDLPPALRNMAERGIEVTGNGLRVGAQLLNKKQYRGAFFAPLMFISLLQQYGRPNSMTEEERLNPAYANQNADMTKAKTHSVGSSIVRSLKEQFDPNLVPLFLLNSVGAPGLGMLTIFNTMTHPSPLVTPNPKIFAQYFSGANVSALNELIDDKIKIIEPIYPNKSRNELRYIVLSDPKLSKDILETYSVFKATTPIYLPEHEKSYMNRMSGEVIANKVFQNITSSFNGDKSNSKGVSDVFTDIISNPYSSYLLNRIIKEPALKAEFEANMSKRFGEMFVSSDFNEMYQLLDKANYNNANSLQDTMAHFSAIYDSVINQKQRTLNQVQNGGNIILSPAEVEQQRQALQYIKQKKEELPQYSAYFSQFTNLMRRSITPIVIKKAYQALENGQSALDLSEKLIKLSETGTQTKYKTRAQKALQEKLKAKSREQAMKNPAKFAQFVKLWVSSH